MTGNIKIVKESKSHTVCKCEVNFLLFASDSYKASVNSIREMLEMMEMLLKLFSQKISEERLLKNV